MANAHRSNQDRSGLTPTSEQLQQSSGSYELVLSAVILGLAGFGLDRWIGTTPVLTVILTVAGFAGAGISLYYRYRHQIDTLQAETDALRTAARSGAGRESNEGGRV